MKYTRELKYSNRTDYDPKLKRVENGHKITFFCSLLTVFVFTLLLPSHPIGEFTQRLYHFFHVDLSISMLAAYSYHPFTVVMGGAFSWLLGMILGSWRGALIDMDVLDNRATQSNFKLFLIILFCVFMLSLLFIGMDRPPMQKRNLGLLVLFFTTNKFFAAVGCAFFNIISFTFALGVVTCAKLLIYRWGR